MNRRIGSTQDWRGVHASGSTHSRSVSLHMTADLATECAADAERFRIAARTCFRDRRAGPEPGLSRRRVPLRLSPSPCRFGRGWRLVGQPSPAGTAKRAVWQYTSRPMSALSASELVSRPLQDTNEVTLSCCSEANPPSSPLHRLARWSRTLHKLVRKSFEIRLERSWLRELCVGTTLNVGHSNIGGSSQRLELCGVLCPLDARRIASLHG
jgi:hypothetical protein